MPTRILQEEQQINTALAAEFRSLKGRQNWTVDQIRVMFRRHKIIMSDKRVAYLLAGRGRMTAAELLVLENQGLSVNSIKEFLRKGAGKARCDRNAMH